MADVNDVIKFCLDCKDMTLVLALVELMRGILLDQHMPGARIDRTSFHFAITVDPDEP